MTVALSSRKTAAPKDRRLVQHETKRPQTASFLRRRAKPRPVSSRPNSARAAGSPTRPRWQATGCFGQPVLFVRPFGGCLAGLDFRDKLKQRGYRWRSADAQNGKVALPAATVPTLQALWL